MGENCHYEADHSEEEVGPMLTKTNEHRGKGLYQNKDRSEGRARYHARRDSFDPHRAKFAWKSMLALLLVLAASAGRIIFHFQIAIFVVLA